jgi:uncharacterized protein (DUF1800 family)
MSADLQNIDPAWAWAPFTPEPRPWSRSLAAHLFRRAGFGANTQQLDDAVRQSPAEVVAGLLSDADEAAAFRSESQVLADAILATGDARNLAPWWLHRMLNTPNQLREKLTLFWHGHFATSGEKVTQIRLMYDQNELLRRNALGDFAAMVRDISRDPAMLIYLDSATNRKAHANENYARELMELFCLGEGNYSEQDVQELARCFTGWEIRRERFRFNRFQHDTGEKTILGQSGQFTGEEAVNLVLEQDSAARFIIGKLFRYLICDEPEPPPALLEPLARQFRDDGLTLPGVLQRMLSSQLFFSPQAVARKVRSPVELAAGLLRCLQGSGNVKNLATETAQLGQSLLFPPNVKGWDGGRAWINSATLLGRANFVRRLLADENTRFDGGTLAELAARRGVSKPRDFVQWLSELLLAVPLASPILDQLEVAVTASKERGYQEALSTLATLPEFQLA